MGAINLGANGISHRKEYVYVENLIKFGLYNILFVRITKS